MMDIAGSVIGLVVLAPLLLMLAIAIKLESRGPVLFRQPRIGRRGQRFWMLKFRSMVDGADQIKDTLREFNEAEGACSRSPTTRASLVWVAFCAGHRWTSCLSC
jgi:lipopolysaccharide/colanic/teichoic acid biosynthesis glycosyltransferase